MADAPKKPQGRSGPLRLSSDGGGWDVTRFPDGKAERERMIAEMFVEAANRSLAGASDPSLAPFGDLVQNPEDDLDFAVSTALGTRPMELAEFAPLREHGPRFGDAPLELHPAAKCDLALALVAEKSAHQGGAGRLLLLYHTEYGFWLDDLTIELMRRGLAASPPGFDRVFYLSPFDAATGSAAEIFPGRPHFIAGRMPDEALRNARVTLPHPTQMVLVRERSAEGEGAAGVYGRFPIRFRWTVTRPLRKFAH
jgi:hypothetical protein